MKDTLIVKSPYDLLKIAELEYNSETEIESMLSVAHQLSQKKSLPIYERTKILNITAKLLASARDSFAMTIASEGGKPLIDAEVEVDRAVQGIENAIETLNHSGGQEVPMGLTPSSDNRMAFTTREPIGVVLAVSAFNHPLNLIIHQVIPAVATGCPVIVKPAGTTPLSCVNFVKLLHEAGLPKGWCQVAIVGNELAEKLVIDSRLAFFSFIGSAKVGWMLRSKLAPGVRCALEHGGAAPAIVEEDADIDRITPLLVKGGFYHAGQVCVSVQRIFAHKNIVDKLIDSLAEKIEALRLGDPKKRDTEVGPLILPREVDRVASWVAEAKKEGAKIVLGGDCISESCLIPTLIAEPSLNSKVSTQEIFGPVVTVKSYDETSEAIGWANSLAVAFQASVFTQDIDRAINAAKKINASAVMINDHTAFRVDWMPFAGRKSSGLGTGGIPHTMHEMTQEKMIVFNYKENLSY